MNNRPFMRNIFVCFVFLAMLLVSVLSFAMQPPSPGEVEELKRSGKWSERLKRAEDLGNHRIKSSLLNRAIAKARQEVLLQQGYSQETAEQMVVLPTPPPADQGMPTTGNVKMFVLLIDFSDYPAYNSSAQINSAIFGDGSLIPSRSN
jgi:hypothetical protein